MPDVDCSVTSVLNVELVHFVRGWQWAEMDRRWMGR